MQPVELEDAFEKLNRGRQHISHIKSDIDTLLGADFYTIRTEADERIGSLEISLEGIKQPSKAINLVIGDAIGNIRSALDYAMIALTAPITGSREKVYFPFSDNANGFRGETKSRLLGFPDAVIDMFINEIQAYENGSGHPIWVLNKLRNIDKHRLLVTTLALANIRVSFDCAAGTIRNHGMIVRQGQTKGCYRGPLKDFKFTDKPRPTFHIFFNEVGLADGIEVTSTLELAADFTQGVLDAIKIVHLC